MSDRLVVMVNKPNRQQLIELSFSLDMVRNVYGKSLPDFSRYVNLEVAIDEKTAQAGDIVRFPIRVAVGALGVPRDTVTVEGLEKHCTAAWLSEGDYASLPEWAVDHVLSFLKRPENAFRVLNGGAEQ